MNQLVLETLNSIYLIVKMDTPIFMLFCQSFIDLDADFMHMF